MDFAPNQFSFSSPEPQVASGPAAPVPDFSDVPAPRPRRRPRQFSGTTYSSTIAPFDDSMWRAGMPRSGGGVQAIPAGESANARRERRLRAKGQFFSFPLYATPPTSSRLDFSKLRDLREGRISNETLKNAQYFSEVLGAGAYARNYDFYIAAVAKAVFDLTNYGPYSTTMRNRYWQPYGQSIASFRSTRPALEAGGDSGPQNINDDVNLFWQLAADTPTGNRGQAFQILRSLAKQIFKGQVDYALMVHRANNPSNPAASLSVSPEFWFATKNSTTRALFLDKMPYGEINVSLDSGNTLRMPIIRALRLLSGAAWLSNSPSAQTQAVIREYTEYMSGALVAATLNPFRFEVQDWGTVAAQPNALMDIVYFYGYWSYIKARSRDTNYWRSAFEEEILHPTACQLPRQIFYQGFLPEITSESTLTAATRDQWTQEFENYCQSIGLPVLAADRLPRDGSAQSGSVAGSGVFGFDFGGATGGNNFGFGGATGGNNFGFGGATGGNNFGFGGATGGNNFGFGGGGAGVGETAPDEPLPPEPAPDEVLDFEPEPDGMSYEPDFGVEPEPEPDEALDLEPAPEKKKLSTGQIAGIAAGTVAAAAGLIYLLRR